MLNFKAFFSRLEKYRLGKHKEYFLAAIDAGLSPKKNGDLSNLEKAVNDAPRVSEPAIDIQSGVTIGQESDLDTDQKAALLASVHTLIPWRKGPFQLFGIDIDTEWQSDYKWQRVLPHIRPLKNKKVLDVGCGSGYHCWRMAGENAAWVFGIDPSPRFLMQFQLMHQYARHIPIDFLPIAMEDLPPRLNFFDTVFSMGVFYHRSAPMDHLKELRDAMKPGGELILETLVIQGKENEVLVPEGRYAQMRNVWFLPSVPTLITWLKKCGFENVRCVDLNQTSTEEQRSTRWMPSHSLNNFLHPDNKNLTIEGYPAPVRAIMIADRPLPKNTTNETHL